MVFMSRPYTLLLLLAAPSLTAFESVLFDFGRPGDLSGFKVRDARLERLEGAISLDTGLKHKFPGLVLDSPKQGWDLSAFQAVALDVKNAGPKGAMLVMRLEDKPKDPGHWNCNTGWIWLEPGQRARFRVPLVRPLPPGLKLFGMRTFPGGRKDDPEALDTSRIRRLDIFASEPAETLRFEISRAVAEGRALALPSPDKFFPFIDPYGQYLHKDWEGKVLKDPDLQARRLAEEAELRARPGPAGRTRFGGWKRGPKLEARGFFYPARHEGKWWLVDPEGRLFFSHGLSVVNLHETTPVTDRESWFKDYPGDSPGFKEFESQARPGHGHYKGRAIRAFDFRRANLKRKYGEGWKEDFSLLTHRRLRSWGFNTIGNWSSQEIYGLGKTPYVVAIHPTGQKPILGSKGFWKDFDDVFDPGFKPALARAMAGQKGKSAGDPWCLGYFVDNELSWDDDTALALATLASPARQPAKLEFIADLRKKYGEVKALNAAWNGRYKSWEDLARSRAQPDGRKAEEDLKAFVGRIAEAYFSACREAVKAVAPRQLYLGCRFSWYGQVAERAAARHCDVVSYNLYRRGVDAFKLPEGVDAPVIVGEFHFGALDLGMFDPGMMEVGSQAERGEAYLEYLGGALRNPALVGCHYFQYADQPVTGRSLDGEPAQIGFVDITDSPYPAMLEASREMGEKLYELRSSSYSR